MNFFTKNILLNPSLLLKNTSIMRMNIEKKLHSKSLVKSGRPHNHFNRIFLFPYYISLRKAHEEGFLKRISKKLKFIVFTKKTYELDGRILFAEMERKIDYLRFFDVCNLPDTFYSWYLVMELHVWMVCVRVMAEGENGKIIRNSVLNSLWLDIHGRSKELKNVDSSALKKQLKVIDYHYQLAFLSYDESLNGDDRVLASAIWRTIFHQESMDPERIECLVNYVRKNLAHLEGISFDELLNSRIEFLPLLEPNQLNSL